MEIFDENTCTHCEENIKRVQWSEELEEIHYFYVPPDSCRKSFKQRVKKLRQKAFELTDKPLKIIIKIGEAGLEFMTRVGPSGSFESNEVTFEDLDKEWDRLFELYGSREIHAAQR